MSNWDSLDPLEFERRCAATLTMLGWSAQTTKGSGDQGVDVVADKEGVRLVLQCKRYSTAVGVDAVQQVYAGQRFYDARFAAVVSNSSFTIGAKELATKCGVKLLHATELAHADTFFLKEDDLEFERRCAESFRTRGWKVRAAQCLDMKGVDLIAERFGTLIVLHCRKFSTAVESKAIENLYSVRRSFDAHYAAVISTGIYANSLKWLAFSCDVKLLHFSELIFADTHFPQSSSHDPRCFRELPKIGLVNLVNPVNRASRDTEPALSSQFAVDNPTSKTSVPWPSFADCQKSTGATPAPPVEIQVPPLAADERPSEDARSGTRAEFALSIVENILVVVALVSGSLLASKYLISGAAHDVGFARWDGKNSGLLLGILLSAAYLFSRLDKGPNRKIFSLSIPMVWQDKGHPTRFRNGALRPPLALIPKKGDPKPTPFARSPSR